MKVDKAQAIAFLKALGFTKAGDWDDDKLKDRISKVPQKVNEAEVPEEFEKLFTQIAESEEDDPIEWGEEKKERKAGPKKAPAKKAVTKKAPAKKTAEPVTKKAPAKKAAASEAPKSSNNDSAVERDEFGSKLGTISAKVNAVLTDEWKEEPEIVEESGVTLDQARGRLYYATQEGVVERKSVVLYRLVKK